MKTARKELRRSPSSMERSLRVAGGHGWDQRMGVYRDRFELKDKLESARQHINAAIKTIDEIDWPTGRDYDQI